MLQKNKIYLGDCLEVMKDIADKSIDAIITDPPYGTTACKLDSIIPFEPMWEQLNRIIKPNGAIVLFGSEPFSSALRMSNIKNYKYDWVWDKKQTGNPFLAKKQPLKNFELIHLFNKHRYYPIMNKGKLRKKGGGSGSKIFGNTDPVVNDLYYPKAILTINNCANKTKKQHPTQKPVKLIEYLIKTYTLENEIVLDFTIGSGTTAVACINTGRNFIGIEKEEKYVDIANKRIKNTLEQQTTAAIRH
jgi:site-specific DNA-methyltransferase (adenine-specific)